MHPGTGGDEASPQLICSITNSAGGTTTDKVIFVTRDPDYNQVAFQIGLTTGSTTLSPGSIPDPLDPPGPDDGTVIYVDLGQFGLSDTAWDGLTFQGQGWAFRKFADRIVGMTPSSAPIPLNSGTSGAISIQVGGVVVPEPPAQPEVQVYVLYYNIPTVPGSNTGFPVAFLNAPNERDADLATVIGASLSANGIVNTVGELRAANRFALQFLNLGRLVPAGPDTTFSITFVYGGPDDDYGFGALADVTTAARFDVRQGDNAANWTITPDRNAQAVTWTLQPPDGAPIVGTGQQAVVAINISNVVTTYQPGPTVILVSYREVPGYKDGVFNLLLNKIQHVSIDSLDVTPNPTYFKSDGSADVTVRWRATAAQSLELTQNYLTTPVTGRTELDATLQSESTTFALRAVGRPGTVENADYRSVNAVALPVINSFAGAPTEIYHGTRAHDATFEWAVDSASDIRLSSTGDAFNGQSFRPIGSTSTAIFQTQMVTLEPRAAANRVTLTRRLVLSAFTPMPEVHQLSFTPGAVAAAPSGPFVVLAGPSTSLTVADTVRYAENSTYELGRVATALVFSADGKILATVNADRTVSIVGVDLGANGMPTFTSLSTITLSHTAQQLVFTPDGQRIFLTVDVGGQEAGRVVALVRTRDGYAVEGSPVAVGRKPRGLTLDAAGARLFVANSGDETVTMIGLTRDGKLGGAFVIPGFTGGPVGVAATPTGRQLLVSCGTANGFTGKVVVVDPDRPETGQRTPLTIGGTPGQLALLPSGSYAAVANGAAGTISLIDCWGPPSSANIPGPPIAVGTAPVAVTASPDGLQVLVAVRNGFCVVTLATYRATEHRPAIPNRPTSLAITPDGESVYAWHDAALPSNPPTPGVLIYDTRSRTVSNLLPDRDVLRLVSSPDPFAKEAFAIIKHDPSLHQIAEDTLETQSYPLGLPSGHFPVALAISGDGDTIYVVASNAERDLTLVVFAERDMALTVVQRLPLYRMASPGQLLVRCTPDGSSVFLVDSPAAQVRVLRRTGPDYVLSPTRIPGDLRANDLAVLPDGSTAYVLNAGRQTNTITVVDVASLNSRVAVVPQPYVNLTALQPSPDGRRLFATDTNAAAVRVLDPRSLRIIQTIPLTAGHGDIGGIMAIVVAADGSRILTANNTSQNLSVVEQIQLGTVTQERPAAASHLWTPNDATAAYTGLFLRHYLGEKPGSPRAGWSASPDLIPYGPDIEPNPEEKFGTPAGYAKDFGKNVALENDNYIYVRGYNDGTEPITSRVYFYYTQGGLALWPGNWRSDKVWINQADQNWFDVKADPKEVGVGAIPFRWKPDDLPPTTDHYCLVAWASDGPNPQPPDLPAYSRFATLDDLINFIVTHHNLAWRNTAQYRTPPPDSTYSTAIGTAAAGASIYLQVTFKDLPLDGEFSVNLQGTDESNSVVLPRSTLADYRGGFVPRNAPLPMPGDFQTSLRVQYWKGKTPVPETAQIKVSMLGAVLPSMMRDIERLYRPMGLRNPIRRLNNVPVVVVGSAQFELMFDKAVQ